MAKLTKEEQEQLDALTKKMEAKDDEGSSKVINYHVDLGDPKQVKTAQKLGFLAVFTDDEEEEEEEEETEQKPARRKGYLG